MGGTAREAYERMIALVTKAEERLSGGSPSSFTSVALPERLATPAAIAPTLRGLLAIETDADEGLHKRFVLEFRTSDAIRRFVDGQELARYSQQGPVTPDHAIRIKPLPVIVPPAAGNSAQFAGRAALAIADYQRVYDAYVARNNTDTLAPKTSLDPSPRIILVPGLGFFAAGDSAKAASVAADLYENNIEVIADAETLGRYQSIGEADMFDIEYWSLEQAKLGKGVGKTAGAPRRGDHRGGRGNRPGVCAGVSHRRCRRGRARCRPGAGGICGGRRRWYRRRLRRDRRWFGRRGVRSGNVGVRRC